MKVLLINNYHYLKGGSDSVYINTGKLLTEKGHEVIYFSTNDSKNIEEGVNPSFVDPVDHNKGGVISRIKKIPRFIYSRTAYNSIRILIKKERPDIAHLHIFYGNLTSSILKALKDEGVPIVMSVHEYKILCPAYTFINNNGDVCEKCANGNYLPSIISKCTKGSYGISLIAAAESYFRDLFYDYKEYVDHFIMVSNFIREKHIQYYPKIADKSSVLYNFQHLDFDITNLKKEVDLVYFGRLSKEKGIGTLLNVLKERKDITLKIIGTGPDQKRIEDFLELNSMDNVALLGFCSGDSLWTHICSAKYSIIPSEWYENNPMTVIESLFLGIPVIGANIGGIPEIIKDGHGFKFKAGSEKDLIIMIDTALNISSEMYLSMQKRSMKFASEMFSKESHYIKLIKIYNEMIGMNR